VPLPTYPFERKRHMVDPAPAAPGVGQAADPLGVTADVGRWLQAPTWARDDAPAPAPQLAGAWLVLAGPGPLGDAVARRLRAAGADPIVVEPGAQRERLEASRFRARPGVAGDLAGIAQEARPGARLAGAIHLWTAAEAPAAAGASPAALAYHALVALAEVLAPAPGGAPATLIAATAGAESVLDEPVRHPEAALAAGPARSLPLEIPGLQARLLDLDPARLADADATAAAVVGEAARTDAERVVAHRGGRRFVRRFERIPAPPAAAATLPLKRGGAYLITGGLGGIGLTLARWIAAQGPARLLLTARTVPPARDAWDAWLAGHPADDRIAVAIRELRAIEAAGSEVLVASADAADEAAMRRALELARARWGELDGVIHAAGISGNNRVAFRKTPEDVAAVLAPKVDGLAVLVRLLGDRPLDFVVLLGSISSVLGGAGVCDYAAANAVLDAFVDSTIRPRSWQRVATFSFGAWRDVGMAARVEVAESRRKAWEEYLRSAIAPAAGAEAFGRALASGRGRVVIAPFDVARAAEAIAAPPARQAEQAGAGGAAADVGVQLPQGSSEASAGGEAGGPERSRPYRAPSTEVERQLAAIWTELLGVERIGLDDDFFELGGHSLLGTRVLARVEQALHARLTLRDVFDAPTLGRLADKVSAATGGGAGSPGDPQGDREEMEF
jgi:NAD(P)-dependent dehydrogenase (short-subunit alcohol dehydrogenase family)